MFIRKGLIALVLCYCVTSCFAQNLFKVHSSSVDSLLVWMERGCDKEKVEMLTLHPAARIMEQIITLHVHDVANFADALHTFSTYRKIPDNLYLLNEAYANRAPIHQLFAEIKREDFLKETSHRALPYFPADFTLPQAVNVFFTLTGWKYGDAMTFCYQEENGRFQLSEFGHPAIMFNLTIISQTYGETRQQILESFANVMTHELFHIFLSHYKDLFWKWKLHMVEDQLMYTLFNEGMAHYVADKAIFEGADMDETLKAHEENAFNELRIQAREICNEQINREDRLRLIASGTYGTYWDKFISNAGLFMAYYIDLYAEKNALKRCIENGPEYFIKTFISLKNEHEMLPELPVEMIRLVD